MELNNHEQCPKERGEYVTTVMGEVITDALISKLEQLERAITEELKERNYYTVKRLAEQATAVESLRMTICTNHLMDIYDIGCARDQEVGE